MSGRAGMRLQGHPGRQRGAIIVLIAIAMLALLAMGGLALDGAHLFLNKSRLQNNVDAAALNSAKVLDDSGDENLARTAAFTMMNLNAAAAGNREIRTSASDGTLTVTVEFSSTLQPFAPGTTPAEYVRVRAQNLRLPAWLVQVVGFDDKVVAASAVAGPSPTILQACGLVPLVVCGTPPSQGGTAPWWGFTPGAPHVLKGAAGQQSAIGPGNFQLLRLGGSGANVLRENLAGGYEGCYDGSGTLPTQPGNDVGPVFQGLNTRLDVYAGSLGQSRDRYPPDVVTQQNSPRLSYDGTNISQGGQTVTQAADLNFNYQDYQTRVENGNYDVQPPPADVGSFERRVLPVPIADCSGVNTGQSDLPILGIGCYFLLQEAAGTGNQANIFGEFVDDCQTGGVPGPTPTSIPGPHLIQLYRNFASSDS